MTESQGLSFVANREMRLYLRRYIKVHYQYFKEVYIEKLPFSVWK